MPKRVQLTDSPNIEHVTSMAYQWSNALLGVIKTSNFRLPEEGLDYQVIMQPWANKMITRHYIGIAFGINGLISTLWISAWPLAEKLNDYAPDGDLQKIPTELQIELVETVFENFIAHFERKLRTKIKVYKLFFDKPFKSTTYSIRFSLKTPDENIVAILIPQNKLIPFFQKKISELPKLENSFWLEQKTRVHFELGSLKLSVRDLRALEASDILFLQESQYFQTSIIYARLASGQIYEVAHTAQDKVQFQTGESVMAENEQETSIADIDDMPIMLSFDLGEEMMTFKQVSLLKPGHILNLKKPFSGLVKIRSQNQTIGQGELVDIEGKVGIRITRLFNQNN
jgi:type III secretion system YscQ/HrcQ family protein